jgi:hypothetical protein
MGLVVSLFGRPMATLVTLKAGSDNIRIIRRSSVCLPHEMFGGAIARVIPLRDPEHGTIAPVAESKLALERCLAETGDSVQRFCP